MRSEAQPDLVVVDGDVRMMVHGLCKPCYAVEEPDSAHEAIEDEQSRYSLAS